MAKGKLATPAWILEGYDSPEEYNKAKGKKPEKKKGKTYSIKVCPKCQSNNVQVVLTGEEGKNTGEWECKKCKWKGRNIGEKDVSEDEFLEIMGEEE